MQNILHSRSEKYSWKNSRPQRINTKAHWNIYRIFQMYIIYVNQHKSVDFYKFQNYASKVIFATVLYASESVHSLWLYRGVWLWNRGLSTLGSVAEKEGETLTRRVAREGGSTRCRGGVECGVANGYCLKRWRMDHGCVGFSGKMDPFFFSAPLLFSQLLAAKSRGWDGWFLERTCSG